MADSSRAGVKSRGDSRSSAAAADKVSRGKVAVKKPAVTKAAANKPAAKKKSAAAAKASPSNSGRGPKAAARIANLLRREIVTGALQTGEMLLPERVLQEQFNVSRPTLREAMRLLESESLITISRGQHGGARVRKLDTGVTARQVGMYLQMEGTTLADVMQARSFLEPPAAGLIATNRSLAVIEQLRDSLEKARKSYQDGDTRALTEEQSNFSEILTSQSSNNTLALLAKLLHAIVRRQMMGLTMQSSSRDGALKMHWKGLRAREKLVAFIEKGEAEEAEKYWRHHVESAAKVVVGSYKGQMPIDVLQEED